MQYDTLDGFLETFLSNKITKILSKSLKTPAKEFVFNKVLRCSL